MSEFKRSDNSRKYILVLLFCGCLYQQSIAASEALQDTIVPVKPHLLNRQQFLDAYGDDDTSRALIKFYFDKKAINKIRTIISASLAAGTAIGLSSISTSNPIGSALGTALLITLFFVAALSIIYYSFQWWWFSRPRLLKQIQKHQNGARLPFWLKYSLFYRAYLWREKRK